jgi:SagB-type dehydrogenase family enzyme
MSIAFDGLTFQLVDLFEGDDHFEAEVFHESSKIGRANAAELSRRVDMIAKDPQLQRMMWTSWKSYEGAPKVKMPKPALGSMTVEEAIRRRRSQIGRYAGGPISFAQLASILRFTYGPTLSILSQKFPGEKFSLRGTPSGGGLYPLEIYPLVFDVEGLDQGIYHYSVSDHSLELLEAGPCRERFRKCTTYLDLADTAAVMFAVTAVMPRTLSKYLFRGYRFLSYDVGACLQSFYLTATALGLGTCALGGFFDNMVGDLLGINNVTENVMILFSVGQPASARQSGVDESSY